MKELAVTRTEQAKFYTKVRRKRQCLLKLALPWTKNNSKHYFSTYIKDWGEEMNKFPRGDIFLFLLLYI